MGQQRLGVWRPSQIDWNSILLMPNNREAKTWGLDAFQIPWNARFPSQTIEKQSFVFWKPWQRMECKLLKWNSRETKTWTSNRTPRSWRLTMQGGLGGVYLFDRLKGFWDFASWEMQNLGKPGLQPLSLTRSCRTLDSLEAAAVSPDRFVIQAKQ